MMNRNAVLQLIQSGYPTRTGVPVWLTIVWDFEGQSNQNGATLSDNGGTGARFVSQLMGTQEPLQLSVNGAGSCLPLLIDLMVMAGVRVIPVNGAIGGASIKYFTGTVGGAVVTGTGNTPAQASNMGDWGYNTNGGAICVEGDANYDPFTFMARSKNKVNLYPQLDVYASWANAESDGGSTAADYTAALVSWARAKFNMNARVKGVLLGLSSSGNNSLANMQKLQGAKNTAISTLQGQGLNVVQGADLFAKWGMFPPLYEERFAIGTKVHLTLEGQRQQAILWALAMLRFLGYF